EVLFNSAEVGNFFQVGVQLLVRNHWKYRSFLQCPWMGLVFLYYFPGFGKDRNPYWLVSLLPAGGKPVFPINANRNIGWCQVHGINVGQSGIAAKYKQISYPLQAHNFEVFLFYCLQFFM